MDYEKLYKESLERAKKLKETSDNKAAVGWCEYIFPELKESEDERIRKYLLKLADRCPEDSIDFMGEVKKEDIIAWLEKQGEHKSINYADEKIVEAVKDISILDMVEPNTAWSEEDENRFNNLKWLVERSNEGKATKEGFIKFINNLKSLKGRVQPQWKPGEEQIQALEYQVNSTYKGSWQYKASKELLEQLKKL